MRKKPSQSTPSLKKSKRSSNGAEPEVAVLPEKKRAQEQETTAAIPERPADPYAQLTGYVDHRELLRVLTEVRNGNFSARMPFDQIGLSGKICDAVNDIISMNERMIQEFTKAGETIGRQGKLNQRI